jgi:hypothetical protein
MNAPQFPTLFNKATEANEYLNAAACRLYTNFIDELSEFVALQQDVIATRLFVQERRKELHRLREQVSERDIMLINCMRERMNSVLPFNKLGVLEYFEASQAARDEIGPVESEYEPLEIMLGSKEHQLVEKYSKVEETFEHLFKLNITPTEKPTEPLEIEYEASSVASLVDDDKATPVDTEHLHGALVGENIGIGQLPRHAGVLNPRSQERWVPGVLHRRSASLGSTDVPRPRSATFADEGVYSGDLTGTLASIGIWITDTTTDLADAHAILRHGFGDESTFSNRNYIEIPSALSGATDDFPVNPGLEEGNPLLLLDEGNETRAILSDYLVNFESTPDRVNRWMLHHLRLSPREIYRLHGQITKLTSKPFHWATSVLKHWPHDNFGPDDPYDQGSVELEESIPNPQVLGYHGACDPECRTTNNWPTNDMWLVEPRSSNFSTGETTPARPTHFGPELHMPTVHELSTALMYDD